MNWAHVLLAAFAALALLDWVAVARQWRLLEYVAKPGALLALLGYAATGEQASSWLLAALACSLVGDVLLMLPADRFIAGLLAFFAAHVAYIGALPAAMAPRLVWLALVLGVTMPISLRLLRAVPDVPLRGGVAAYTLVIAVMVSSALASDIGSAVVGGLFFLVSDTLLGWNRFVRPLASARVAIMVTYHLGQLGLTAALR
jgi:uncharacterized membrane protein YhhN